MTIDSFNVMGVTMLSLILLVVLPTRVATIDDQSFREFLVPEIQNEFEPYLFGDSYWLASSSTRKTADYTSDLPEQILQANGFSSLEDTIFTYRSNVVEWSLRFFDTVDHRISYAGVYMACFSERKTRSPNGFRVEDWRHHPRPVVIVPIKPNTTTDDVVFRTWPSKSELHGDKTTDISWCLGPASDPEASGEDLGIQKDFEVASKVAEGDDVYGPTVEDIAKKEGDSIAALSKLRLAYASALDKEWSGRDGRIRYIQTNVKLSEPVTGNLTTDYDTETANQKPSQFAKILREAIDKGQDRLFKITSGNQLDNETLLAPRQPDRSSWLELVLAISSAIAGSVLEDLLLMRILERRTIKHGKDSLPAKSLLFSLILTLVCFDLFPLVFLVVEETEVRKWSAYGARSFIHTAYAPGKTVDGIRPHPEGHSLLLGIETWQVTSTRDSRSALIAAFLVAAIGLHACIFGYRAFVALADMLRHRHIGIVARKVRPEEPRAKASAN